jgi:hypothetical protein
MYQSFPIDRQRGLISLATHEVEKDGGYVAFCTNHTRGGVSLHSNLDANQNLSDPDELLQVLSTKVQRLAAMRERGGRGTEFEAGVRDVCASAQRLLEKVIGRKQT